ncbi:MAG: efflux RND transporter periplasmic adaptor subunit [Victivallaceae bacterium]
MNAKLSRILKRSGAALLLIAAVGLAVILIQTGPRPTKKKTEERQYLVDAITIAPIDVTPRISGYGEVESDKTWKAVAQVSGKIVWKADNLKSGNFFKTGEVMVKIDSRQIKLAVAKGYAEIKKYQAKIAELKNQQTNMESRLEILKKVYEFNKSKLTRQRKLFKSKAVASVTVEEEEINVLKQQSSIVELATTIKLIPAQIAYQEAELAAAEANLKQSELDLSYTQITAPFDCRVRTVSIEIDQYVTSGQDMFTADAINQVEIPVQFSMDQLDLLVNSSRPKKAAKADRKNPRDEMDITVSVNGGAKKYSWKGKFLRIASGVDTSTRMLNLVVGVANPYKRDDTTVKPPLDRGLFCSVLIRGKTVKDLLVVPRYAVHDGRLYIAGKDLRLEIRPVKIAFNIEQYAVIESGLKSGETVIVSDIVPAVPGMKLKLKKDNNFIENAEKELR